MNPPSSISRLAVLIPARRHEPMLPPLIDVLLDAKFGAVIVVDDGSPPRDKEAFDALARKGGVHLVRHAANRGKGRALKTGINYFLKACPGFAGLVTADADGQHSATDILRVACALVAAPDRVAFGSRGFGPRTPLRNRFGNALTRQVFHCVSGCRIQDTQTGLRAFPAVLLPELAALPGERYEYEMTVLAHLCRRGSRPVEVPIATIYIDRNSSSAFNSFYDSIRIYFVILRFSTSSLVSAGIDFAVFAAIFGMTHNILASLIAGRVSLLANFLMNKPTTFRSRLSFPGFVWCYSLLAVGIAAASYGSICAIYAYLRWNVLVTKIVVETVLSLVSFSIQQTFMFPANEER